MGRKKKHPEHVNHERWLISYADFITLLFAFFVVMFAVSQTDSKKVGRFTESFSKAIGVDMFPSPGKGLLEGTSDGPIGDPEAPKPTAAVPMLPEELNSLKKSLMTTSTKDSALKGVEVITKRNEVVLRLSDTLLFESGDDALEDRSRRVVAHLAQELRDRAVDIRVEGHTDDRPIRTARFRSNWDLSTARASTIVARLAAEGIPPSRLSAAGYGEFRPLGPNNTDEGRKVNRRVDFVISIQVPQDTAPTSSGHVGDEAESNSENDAPKGDAADAGVAAYDDHAPAAATHDNHPPAAVPHDGHAPPAATPHDDHAPPAATPHGDLAPPAATPHGDLAPPAAAPHGDHAPAAPHH